MHSYTSCSSMCSEDEGTEELGPRRCFEVVPLSALRRILAGPSKKCNTIRSRKKTWDAVSAHLRLRTGTTDRTARQRDHLYMLRIPREESTRQYEEIAITEAQPS